mmetsp:Transcript_15036/g.40328  ORF Transcript_15036/g.40328 Transcript_15036/m.40328 type:complete len:110 (+) Transcript_15036:78-407(+)
MRGGGTFAAVLVAVVAAVAVDGARRKAEQDEMLTYIVKCHDNAARAAALAWVERLGDDSERPDVVVRGTKSLDAVFAGFIIECSPAMAEQLRKLDSVAYVESDELISTS